MAWPQRATPLFSKAKNMRLRNSIGIGCWMTLLFCDAAFSFPADNPPLIDAIKNGDRAAVRSLIEHGANVNAASADGTTALAWAVNRDDVESAELLIRARANVNAATDYGVTPLSLACTNRNAVLVEALLKAGANPHAILW